MQAYEQPIAIAGQVVPRAPWWRVVRAWARRQIAAEVYGMPGYGLTLKGPSIEGFIAAPHEIRPAVATTGKAMMAGRYTLGGARMSIQGSGDPWNRPSPTRSFAIELHRFCWLRHLLTQGEDGVKEGLRLFLLWEKTFRTWTPFVWSQEVMARRLINLSIFARRLAAYASEDEAQILARSMAEQTRQLWRLPRHLAWYTQKATALVLVGCVLSGHVGDRMRKKGLRILPKALKRAIMADGSHASRSPQAGLELLYDLLLIEDALNQRGLAIPEYLEVAIERLSRFVRTLSHPDGSLCAFQGGESVDGDSVAPALLHEDKRPLALSNLPLSLEHGRYHRMLGRSLSVFVDAGEPKPGVLGYGACDHPMNFEVSGGRDKLFVTPGWSSSQSDQHGFRVVSASNSLTIGEGVILSPITGKFGELLHFTLEGLRYRIRSRRIESDDSGSLLEMEHEGWRPQFGLKHERRLYVDPGRDELRGEEKLIPVEPKKELAASAPYALRFLLHPEVQASLARDKRSILLRGPGGRGWWLRHDAKEVVIEESAVFDKGLPKKSTTLCLRGICRLDTPTRIRWKLSPAEG
ncbi:heparinase II/III family protein [Asticcacaulis sp. YBE204]|uniref:heparinase II/III family protein n=1 Tax=Asticcacaulis sp. YBE204 TaxID=1282363 RepID=UPI0003C3E4D6|nr:heparinase II/III family protein [Asticcacaulis sp. YBE204]ESQ80826.1 heparinase [Asticcacaulis sp. YBE204]